MKRTKLKLRTSVNDVPVVWCPEDESLFNAAQRQVDGYFFHCGLDTAEARVRRVIARGGSIQEMTVALNLPTRPVRPQDLREVPGAMVTRSYARVYARQLRE